MTHGTVEEIWFVISGQGDVLQRHDQAFSGAIQGTLDNIAVDDTLWLRRFAEHPASFRSLRPVLATALLSQQGIDFGATDLLLLIPETRRLSP